MTKKKVIKTIVAPEPLEGRRAINKREKLDRIKRASRELFIEYGYEGATLRQIATRAEVAFGTLFLYAKDKADLLLLLFDEELQMLGNRAFKRVERDDPFIDQLLTIFREFYRFFLQTPELSRCMMREATFSAHAPPADRLMADMRRTEGRLAQVVAEAQQDGKVASRLAADVVAQFIFMIYRAEIRAFLNDERPLLEEGLRVLRRDLQILIDGVGPP